MEAYLIDRRLYRCHLYVDARSRHWHHLRLYARNSAPFETAGAWYLRKQSYGKLAPLHAYGLTHQDKDDPPSERAHQAVQKHHHDDHYHRC